MIRHTLALFPDFYNPSKTALFTGNCMLFYFGNLFCVSVKKMGYKWSKYINKLCNEKSGGILCGWFLGQLSTALKPVNHCNGDVCLKWCLIVLSHLQVITTDGLNSPSIATVHPFSPASLSQAESIELSIKVRYGVEREQGGGFFFNCCTRCYGLSHGNPC